MGDIAEAIYGLLAPNWRMVRLKTLVEDGVAELQTGPFGTMLHASAYQPTGTPVIAVQHIGENSLRQGEYPLVDDDNTARLSRYKVRENDILFGRKGAVDRRALIRPHESGWLQGSDCIRLRFNKTIDARYISYILGTNAYKQWIVRHAHGATMPSLNQEILGLIPLPLPPLPEQKRIAHILGTLDDKIELNRRMNATLEAMARALFKSWFVDFDPVRRNTANKGKRCSFAESPSAEHDALFPAAFQDSPIGPIPKGWKVERFDAHITAERGLSYNGAGLRDDRSGLPMHNLNSIYEGGGYKHEGLKYYAGEYRDKHLVHPGDMIVTNTEQGFDHLLIGHAAIVPACYGKEGIFSHHIYRVRHKPTSPLTAHYLVQLFNSQRWHYWISGFSNGTTINMLPMDALEMPLLVVPPADLVKKFTSLAEAAHAQVETNLLESRTLATVRDTLLPKLLSGEIQRAEVKRDKQ